MTPDNNGRASDAMKQDLSEAGTHYKAAAVAAGDALKGAASAAGDEMRLGKAQMKAELADGTLSGISAAENLGAFPDEINGVKSLREVVGNPNDNTSLAVLRGRHDGDNP